MKSMQLYLLGYVVLVVGLIASLWKLGVLERVGMGWTVIGVVIAFGIGIMLSVSMGKTNTLEVDEKH